MSVIDDAHAAVDDLVSAREALAKEWVAASPTTSDEVASFYTHSVHMADDLDAWHETPERQLWTDAIVGFAETQGFKSAVDIGCGGGHELRALRDLLQVEVTGVEPNDRLRRRVLDQDISCVSNVADGPIEEADLVLCLDVLEHVVDPETFITEIGKRAKFGAFLIESTATFDMTTPLHLAENRGWHPGHALELVGWEMVDHRADIRVNVWQKLREAAVAERAGLLICCYRDAPTLDTSLCITQLISNPMKWRMTPVTGDGFIPRARSRAVSRWYRETADDVFLMIDDDIYFEGGAAEKVIDVARRTRSIACAAYPVRDGAHLALRANDDDMFMDFGPDLPPRKIKWAATGFMAVHRDVIDAMVQSDEVKLVNTLSVDWTCWTLFMDFLFDAGDFGYIWLSEDYAFSERARRLGFEIWLDPSVRIDHQAKVPLNVTNMTAINKLIKGAL